MYFRIRCHEDRAYFASFVAYHKGGFFEMETKDFGKERIFRLMACGLSLLLVASFFIPWVTVVEHAQGLSPFRLAVAAYFPYNTAYPVLFVLAAIPLAVAVASFTKLSFGRLAAIAFAGILGITVFNIFFAHSLDIRVHEGPAIVFRHVEVAAFFWLVVIAYMALLGVLLYGTKATRTTEPTHNVEPPYRDTQKLTTSAILLVMAVIIAFVSIPIYVGGVAAVRISFAGIFNNTTAILFGPLFGGIQRALQDMISHFVRPMGAFLWPITVVALLRGAATGWMWLRVRNVRPSVYSIVYSITFGVILAFGLFNLGMQLFAPQSDYVVFIAPRGGEGLFFSIAYYISSWGLIIAGVIGLLPQFIVHRITQKNGNRQFYDRFIKFLVAVLVPGVIFNSINTVVIFFAAVSPAAFSRGFVYFWAPRFFEEIVTSTIIVYIMVLLMEVYEKAMKRKIVQSTR